MKRWTTITNVGYYETIREDAGEGETNWTVSQHARRGDKVFLYVCAPVSAIVATAIVSEMPAREDDPGSIWCGLYFADMHNLCMLENPITRADLLLKFPDWRYWKQPRSGIQVPKEYEAQLDRLLSNERGRK